MIGHPPFFRLAARLTRNVRRRFARQRNLVEREVYRRLQVEVRQVVGVSWRGPGAAAFAQELNDAFFPVVRQATAAIAQLDQQLAAAACLMSQADEQIESTAGQLTENFDHIYGP